MISERTLEPDLKNNYRSRNGSIASHIPNCIAMVIWVLEGTVQLIIYIL